MRFFDAALSRFAAPHAVVLPCLVLPCLVLPGLLLASGPAAAQIPVVHGVLQSLVSQDLSQDAHPQVTLATPDRPAVIYLECPVGEKRQSWTSAELATGETFEVVLPYGPTEPTTVSCLAVARFANGLSERRELTLSWSWKPAAEPGATMGDGDPSDDLPAPDGADEGPTPPDAETPPTPQPQGLLDGTQVPLSGDRGAPGSP